MIARIDIPSTERQPIPRIVVADDDLATRKMLQHAMSLQGYEVVLAEDGRVCLEICEQLVPDMILLDGVMPEVDGFACCARLNALLGDSCPPILMITSLDDREAVDRAFEAGATDFVTKPIHWAVLSQRVRRLMQAHWNTVELRRKVEGEKQLVAQLEIANSNLEAQVARRTIDLQQSLEFESLLKRITDNVRESLKEDQILQTVVQELVNGLGLGSCNVGFFNADHSAYTIRYEYTRTLPSYQDVEVSVASLPDGFHCIASGQSLYHLWEHPLRGPVVVVSSPLQTDDDLLGVLHLIRDRSATFSELEIRLAQQVANQCAIAIRQARLYQAARQQIVELKRLNCLKDDFLSTVSHELRTPLTSMRMALRMLKQAPTPAKQNQYQSLLEEQCEREIHLVDDLLTLQQLSADEGQWLTEEIDLIAWLRSIVESYAATTQSQQLSLELLPSTTSEIWIKTDTKYLTRVLRELLTNACKYTKPGGHIVVDAVEDCNERGQCGVGFLVRNTGAISASELPHVFEKFYRIPSKNQWGQGGTGLGLALVKQILTHLGGGVSASSHDGWVEFCVRLPGTWLLPEGGSDDNGENQEANGVQPEPVAGSTMRSVAGSHVSGHGL